MAVGVSKVALIAQEDEKPEPASSLVAAGDTAPPDFDAFAAAGHPSLSGMKNVFHNFAEDQKQIWTSPARTRLADASWLVPLGGLAAGLFATDRQYSASLTTNPSTLRRYKTISNAGLAGLAGAGAGMYLMSFPAHNDHWRETGFLAGDESRQ